ncbi:37S ribosomal protein S22 [Neonectria punicea]|uniref:37S ribosomal protein S22 n=1 Tax=Neonectria punicea TaxID=979145 RepID=A0ABR1H6X6_9HYPO
MISILQFIRRKQSFEREKGPYARCTSQWVQMLMTRDAHLSDLEKRKTAWKSSSGLIVGRSTAELAFIRLEMNHLMAVILMKNLFSETEMSYDEYNADFIRLLSLSESLLNNLVRDLSLPVLSLDSGVIPSLFYIALKCRDPKTRRKALQLLKFAPDREGMWYRDTMYAASTWKVAMEEAWNVGQPGEEAFVEPARIYGETVTDSENEDEPATVRFSGGLVGSESVSWQVTGLLSRLGDFL